MDMSLVNEKSDKTDEAFIDLFCEISPPSICRICLERNATNKRMYNIFEAKIQLDVSATIMSLASVQIAEDDGLPNMICEKCMVKLNVAWQFKTQCEISDAKLRDYYSHQLPTAGAMEQFDLNTKKDDLCTVDYSYINIVEQAATHDSNQDNSMEESCKSDESKKPAKQKSDKVKDPKIHQCDTCGKTFNRREYLTQHIRIHTGEKPYHCHLCEKRFVNSGHLSTHMRTHTGEKPHICSLCPKAFSTRQELQKHTMVHNGERPFVCKMCGKCFGSSSNLYSHLKHHTGEKNFTCEHCGKAFYTKQELKQHLVVHTGEKAFVCEFCNKRFSQVAHLRRHSKLHT